MHSIRGSDQKCVVHVACLSYKALEPARTFKDKYQRMKQSQVTSISPSIAKKRKGANVPLGVRLQVRRDCFH